MSNIKNVIKKSGIRQWQIAEYLGVNEFTLSRKLRKDISPDFENQILKAIAVIKAGDKTW